MMYPFVDLSLEKDLSKIEAYWLDLSSRYPHSMYQSWDWIATWIATLDNKRNVCCRIYFSQNSSQHNKPVLGFFVGWRYRARLPFWPERRATLNETGRPEADRLTIEQNGVLGSPEVLHKIIADNSFFKDLHVQELAVRFASEQFKTSIEKHCQHAALFFDPVPSYFVDLAALRKEGKQFDEVLSSNRRQQIRRSIRKYESDGPIELIPASSAEQALEMLDQLAEFHQATWQQRGHSGSFGDVGYLRFHRGLINRCFSQTQNKIFICEIKTPSQVLGYIYGFIHNGAFLFYQSGFKYHPDNRMKPGFISHYLLIKHFLTEGLDCYDFLAGGTGYKDSLATHRETSYHIAVRRRNLITALLRIKHARDARREMMDANPTPSAADC